MSWPAGTIVVCVDDSNCANVIRGRLAYGELYTVRFSMQSYPFADGDGPAVWVNEAERLGSWPPPEVPDFPFGAFRFRKVEGGTCEAERARAMKPVEVTR